MELGWKSNKKKSSRQLDAGAGKRFSKGKKTTFGNLRTLPEEICKLSEREATFKVK